MSGPKDDHLRYTADAPHARISLGREADRLRVLAEISSDLIWCVGPSGEVVSRLPGWEKFTGQSPDEAAGWGWLNALHPAERQLVSDCWRQSCRAKSPLEIRCRVRRHDGAYRQFAFCAHPLVNARGDIEEWFGAFRDASKGFDAAEGPTASEEHFGLAILGSTDGIWDWNAATGKMFISPRFKWHLGYSEEELSDSFAQIEERLHPEDLDGLREALRLHFVERSPFCVSIRIRDRSGTYHWFDARGEATWDDDGLPVRMVGWVSDATERIESRRALQSAADRLRDIERIALMGSFEWTARTDVVWWSDGMHALFGVPPGQFDGRLETMLSYLHPRDAIRVRSSVAELKPLVHQVDPERADTSVIQPAVEVRLVGGLDRERIVDIRSQLHFDREGRLQRVTGTYQDVTVRRRSEMRIEIQSKVTEILANAKTLEDAARPILQALSRVLGLRFAEVWMIDGDGLSYLDGWSFSKEIGKAMNSFNRGFRFRFGEGIPGKAWESGRVVWSPSVPPIVRGEGEASNCDCQRRGEILCENGLNAGLAFPIRCGAKPFAVITCFADRLDEPDANTQVFCEAIGDQIGRFSERASSQAKLRLYHRCLESVGEGIFITEASRGDNSIVYANSGLVQITGYDKSTLLDLGLKFLQGPHIEQGSLTILQHAFAEQVACSLELLAERSDGDPYWARLTVTPVRDRNGCVSHFVGILQDITEQKEFEERFVQSQKMESIGRLAGGVAHDFNNLLTIILGYAEEMADSTDGPEDYREMASEICNAGLRAASLTEQLLAFSRKQVLDPRVVDIGGWIRDSMRMVGRLLGEHIQVRLELEKDLSPVRVDPTQLTQILVNLSVNARDAMPGGGQLTIEVSNCLLDECYADSRPEVVPGEYVMLSVSDNGMGMSPEVKRRVFEPFFTTKPRGMGTGMGLSTVFGIVKQSGGHISVYSEIDQGTTFNVYLPSADESHRSRPLVDEELGQPRSTETILVVEDELPVISIAVRILESRGFTVFAAQTAEEALQISRTTPEPIDLLLTDVVMPQMSGRQLAEILSVERPGIRVLYMSGYTDNAIVHHGVLDQGIAFLHKPFSRDRLISKIRSVLDRPDGSDVAE